MQLPLHVQTGRNPPFSCKNTLFCQKNRAIKRRSLNSSDCHTSIVFESVMNDEVQHAMTCCERLVDMCKGSFYIKC
jgi:hypothetical protein